MTMTPTPDSLLSRPLCLTSCLYGVLLIVAAGLAWVRWHAFMSPWEQAILVGTTLGLFALGWLWHAWQPFLLLTLTQAAIACLLYHGHLAQAEHSFWLMVLLSSQSSILWMGLLFCMATLCFWAGLLARRARGLAIGNGLTWAACQFGLSGLLTRWYESYLIGRDIGHIPLSNLYEVFVLFCLITALLYLHYQTRYQAAALGAFVLLLISSAVAFIFWYTFDRQGQAIEPLIPALQSWWMKIHVPANFIGYGAFSLAAMTGIAQLFVMRGWLADQLPDLARLEQMTYRAISVGFLFFTIATILGALWAADAWGGYWSWDPKETWALIVWLNYAAWLHGRLVKGWHSKVLAWWAVIGLLLTSFAFLGVNLFLSGLHSYGEL